MVVAVRQRLMNFYYNDSIGRCIYACPFIHQFPKTLIVNEGGLHVLLSLMEFCGVNYSVETNRMRSGMDSRWNNHKSELIRTLHGLRSVLESQFRRTSFSSLETDSGLLLFVDNHVHTLTATMNWMLSSSGRKLVVQTTNL